MGGLASAPALAQDDRAKLRDTLLELEIGSWQFVKDKNTEAMKGFLTDDAALIFYDGGRYTKAAFLKVMPDFRLDNFTVDRSSAEVLLASPDVAALLYRITYTSAIKGAKVETRHGQRLRYLCPARRQVAEPALPGDATEIAASAL